MSNFILGSRSLYIQDLETQHLQEIISDFFISLKKLRSAFEIFFKLLTPFSRDQELLHCQFICTLLILQWQFEKRNSNYGIMGPQ